MAENSLEYTLRLNKGNFESGMKSAEDATRKLDDGFSKLKETMLEIVGITAGIEFFKSAVDKFVEADKIATQLKFTLSKRGGLAGSFEELQEQSEKLAMNSMFSHVEIEKAENALLNYGVSVKNVKEHIQTLAGIGGVKDEGIEEIAMKIAQATKVGRFRALAEYGIDVKHLTAEFKAGASQAYLFNETMGLLDKKFAGAGAAMMDSYAGKIHKLKMEYEHLQEEIGRKVIPVILDLIKWIKENKETLESLAIGIGSVITAIKLYETVATISAAINPFSIAITAAGILLALLVKIHLQKESNEEQAKTELNNADEERVKEHYDDIIKKQIELNHLKKATPAIEKDAFAETYKDEAIYQDKINSEIRKLQAKYTGKWSLIEGQDKGQADYGDFMKLINERKSSAAAIEKIAPKLYKGKAGEDGKEAPPAKEEHHNEHIVINITKMVETLEIHPATIAASAAQIRDQVGAIFQQLVTSTRYLKAG